MGEVSVAAVPAATLQEVVDRARLVPDRYRDYSTSWGLATGHVRVPEELLARVLDVGFPHARVDGQLRFDRKDLKNLLLRTLVPSPQRDAVQAIADTLNTAPPAPSISRKITAVSRCPEPGHGGACDLVISDLLTKPVDEAITVLSLDARQCVLSAVIRSGPATLLPLSDDERQVFERLAELEFQHIPTELAVDPGFARETGMADCRLAYRYMCVLGEEIGMRIRPAAGIAATPPFSNTHAWAEVHDGQGWTPVDPFFIARLVRWGFLAADEWPVNRVPLGLLVRLGEHDEALMSHRGVEIPPMLLTTAA